MLVGHHTRVDLFTRLSEADALASGYIFFGQAQVGKKTFAESLGHYLEGRIFEPQPHILQETLLVQPKNESIGIDTARKIKAYLSETPIASSKRMVIIDNAEALTLQAENALLKISEESPKGTLLIFIVASPEALLGTLASRLQKIYFGPVSDKDLEKLITKKDLSVTKKKEFITMAGGSPGRLVELLEDKNGIEKIAEEILTASKETRKKLVKEYLDNEESPLALLDALLLVSFAAPKKQTKIISGILKAKRGFSTLNLNPRLQLENIFS